MSSDRKPTSNPNNSGRSVQSLDRAIAILEALSHAPVGLSLSNLSRAAGLAPQTLQSLLRTLQHHGWVVQDGYGHPYRLGPAPGVLHRRRMEHLDRAGLAAPVIEALCRDTGEYVVLVEWSNGRLMPLAEVHPSRELAVRGESFSPERLHTMATGKLLLAYLDEDQRRAVVRTLPMNAQGPRSITNRDTLLRQLRTIRREALSVCEDEAVEGVVAMAVPVSTAIPGRTAALGIALPKTRCPERHRDRLIELLRQASKTIQAAWE